MRGIFKAHVEAILLEEVHLVLLQQREARGLSSVLHGSTHGVHHLLRCRDGNGDVQGSPPQATGLYLLRACTNCVRQAAWYLCGTELAAQWTE